VKCLT